MITKIGTINAQSTSGDTDFEQDLPLNAEFVDQQLDTRQNLFNKQALSAVSKSSVSQNEKALTSNAQTEAPRAMKAAAWTNYERRIF